MMSVKPTTEVTEKAHKPTENSDILCAKKDALQPPNILSSNSINLHKRNRQSDSDIKIVSGTEILAQPKEALCNKCNSESFPSHRSCLDIETSNKVGRNDVENSDTQFDKCSVAKKPRDEMHVDIECKIDQPSKDIWSTEPTTKSNVESKQPILAPRPLVECHKDETGEHKAVAEDYR